MAIVLLIKKLKKYYNNLNICLECYTSEFICKKNITDFNAK